LRRPAKEIILITGFTPPAVYRALAELTRYELLLKQGQLYFLSPDTIQPLIAKKAAVLKNFENFKQ